MGRGGRQLIFQKGSNYLITESSMACVSLPLILKVPDLPRTTSSLRLWLAEVTLVHVFYTLVAFSLLLAKQTFLFLRTFMLILWFLKLDSGSWRPEFPQQLEALSATGCWQADNQVFQITLGFFFFLFFFLSFLLSYFSYTLSFKHHIINCVHPVLHAMATALKSQ